MIKSSDNLKKFIRESEAFRPEAYDDGVGNITIGYGDTRGDKSKPISIEEAEERMQKHLVQTEQEVAQYVTRTDLTQGKIDALVDMTYNLGAKKLLDNGFYDKVNSGNDEEVINSISQYTKATDKKTGEMKELPGLRKRMEARVAMWKQGDISQAQMEDENAEDIRSVLAQVEDSPDYDNASDIEAVLAQGEAPAPVDEVSVRQSGLEIANQAADTEELRRVQEAQDVADRLQIPLDQAEALLTDSSPQRVETESRIGTIAKNSPATASWAKKPVNYAVMEKSGVWATSVEAASKAMNSGFVKDAERALSANKGMYESSLLHINMALGRVPVDKGIEALKAIDEESKVNQIESYNEDVQRLSKAGSELSNQMVKYTEYISKVWDGDDDTLDKLKSSFDGSAKALDDVLGYAEVVANNYPAATLMSLQSIGSFAAPVAGAAVGAAAGFIAPVPGGAAVGAGLGAFAGGGLLSFGMYLNEKLQEFADPETGEIDYQAAYSDPERLKMWRKQAATYGVAMGAVDVLTTKLLGRFLVKPIKNLAGSKSTLKKGVGLGTGLAVEGTVQMAGEGLSETGATIAADVVGGELSPKSVGKALGKGLEEAAISGPGGAIMGTGAAIVRVGSSKTRAAFIKTSDVVKKANKANSNFNKIQEIRNVKDSNTVSKEHPQSTEALVKTSVKSSTFSNMDTVEDADVISDEAIAAEERRIDQEVNENTVRIMPSEWAEFFKEKGLNADEQMAAFGPDIYESYIESKENDSSVSIPLEKWLRYTDSEIEVDAIARFGDSELNAIEGEDVVNRIAENPFVMFEDDGKPREDLPPTPSDVEQIDSEDATSFETDVPENVMEEPTLRQVKLYSAYRNDGEKKLYNSILGRLKSATKDSEVDGDAVQVAAEIQFRHLRMRAEVTGQPLDTLAKRFKIGRTKVQGAKGEFQFSLDSAGYMRILFSKDADTKTVVHEMGHMWLQEMAEDWNYMHNLKAEEMTLAQQEYVEAMEIAAKYLGMETLEPLLDPNLNRAKRTRIHETFAQTTELYFLEGKFENSRVKKMMESFRGWMRKFAGLVGLTYPDYPPIKLNPEVERMFTIIMDASNKAEEQVIPMFPAPMFPEEMLGAKGGDYLDAYKDALDEAIGEVYSKSFNGSIREREKLINESLDRIYDKAKTVVDQRPAIQIKNQFEALYAQFKKGELASDPRINYESFFKDILGGDKALAERLKGKLPRTMVTGRKKGPEGMNAMIAVQQLGLNDPKMLIGIMLEANNYDSLIEAEANKIMDQELPPLKSDEQIHEIAVQAVQNTGKEKLLLKEFKKLAEKNLPALKKMIRQGMMPPDSLRIADKAVRGEIKFNGAITVAKTDLDNFSPNKYLKDSAIHGKKAADLFAAGNISEAFDEKYNELIQFYAYRASKLASKLVAKTRIRAKQFSKYTGSKEMARRYEADLMNYGRQIIQLVAAGRIDDLPAFETEGLVSQDRISGEAAELINDKLDAFVRLAKGRTGGRTPIGAYIAFGEFLDLVQNQARKTKLIEIGNKSEALEVFVDRLVQDIGDPQKQDPKKENEKEFLYKLYATTTNLRSTLSSLFKNDIDFTKSSLGALYNYVANAEALRNKRFNIIRNKVAEGFKKTYSKDFSMMKIVGPIISRIPFMPSTDDFTNPVFMKNLNITLRNKGELIKMLLYAGSESGMEKVLRGGLEKGAPLATYNPETNKIDDRGFWADIEAAIKDGKLTKEDFDFMQTVWDSFAEMYPDVKKSIRATDGRDVGYIEAREVKTPWGSYRGGYIPVSVSKDAGMIDKVKSLLSADDSTNNTNEMFPNVSTGMTNERKAVFYPVNLDLSKIMYELSQVANVAYLREPMINAGKALSHPDVVRALEDRRPGIYEMEIFSWFQRVSMQQYSKESHDSLNVATRLIRRNVNIGLYFANYATWIRQFIGLGPAAKLVGSANLSRAFIKTSASPKQTLGFIKSKSPRMADRFENFQKDKIRSFEQLDTNVDWISLSQDFTEKITFLPIQIAQTYVDMAVWIGSYDKALAEGLSEPDAVAFADTAVGKSQSDTSISAMSEFQFGDDFKKLFTMISAVPLAMMSLMTEEYRRNPGLIRKASAMASLAIFTVIAPAILNKLLTDALRPGDVGEDDDEKYMDDIALSIVGEGLDSSIPVVGRMAGSALTFGKVQLSPAISRLQQLPTAVRGAYRSTQGVEMSSWELTTLMNTFTLMTGVPLTIIGKGFKLYEASTQTPQEKKRFLRRRKRQLKKLRREEK